MARPKHPNKEIEDAVAYAESLKWRWQKLTGHGWGELLCPLSNRDGCRIFVYSTPRSTIANAKAIRRIVDRCVCKKEEVVDEKS